MSNIGNIRNFTHKELRNMEQDTLVVDAELGARTSIFSMKWHETSPFLRTGKQSENKNKWTEKNKWPQENKNLTQ